MAVGRVSAVASDELSEAPQAKAELGKADDEGGGRWGRPTGYLFRGR
jgi:hypothetical protein